MSIMIMFHMLSVRPFMLRFLNPRVFLKNHMSIKVCLLTLDIPELSNDKSGVSSHFWAQSSTSYSIEAAKSNWLQQLVNLNKLLRKAIRI